MIEIEIDIEIEFVIEIELILKSRFGPRGLGPRAADLGARVLGPWTPWSMDHGPCFIAHGQ